MSTDSTLSLGDKIRQIRISKGFSQENLAQAIGRSIMFISRLERGDAKIEPEMLADIKQYLGIEKAPLLESEVASYESRLWAWHYQMHARRENEAKGMKEELSKILDLPFERNLIALYKMLDVRMLIEGKDFANAEEDLNAAEVFLDGTCNKVLYLYHRNKCEICYSKRTFENNYETNKEGLKHALLAYNYKDDKLNPDAALTYLVGDGYLAIGMPVNAMAYFEIAKTELRGDYTHTMMHVIEFNLASCYILLGYYKKAKNWYEASLVNVRSFYSDDKKSLLGRLLTNLCFVSYKMRDYDEFIKYNNEAMEYIESIDDMFLRLTQLLLQAHGLALLNDYKGSTIALEKGMALMPEGNEGFTMAFDTVPLDDLY